MNLRPYFLLIALFMVYLAYPQQVPLQSQYMMNGFTINPALAGEDGFTTVNVTARQQWLGSQSVQQTYFLSLQTRLFYRSFQVVRSPNRENKFIPSRKGRVGLGLQVYNDRNGYFFKTGIQGTYAYHIPFPNAQLSFGLTASINQFRIDDSNFDFRNLSDPLLMQALGVPIYVPDANIGVRYVNRDLYCGFSASQLMQSYVKFGSDALTQYRLKRTYYLIGGYRFSDKAYIIYEPSFLVKTTEQLFSQIDLSLKVLVRDDYWAGMSYRYGNGSTAIFFLGLKLKRALIGYAYDYQFTSLQRFTYGSHEIMLALRFGDDAKRYRWIRRY